MIPKAFVRSDNDDASYPFDGNTRIAASSSCAPQNPLGRQVDFKIIFGQVGDTGGFLDQHKTVVARGFI